jgi:hypothetical protein
MTGEYHLTIEDCNQEYKGVRVCKAGQVVHVVDCSKLLTELIVVHWLSRGTYTRPVPGNCIVLYTLLSAQSCGPQGRKTSDIL